MDEENGTSPGPVTIREEKPELSATGAPITIHIGARREIHHNRGVGWTSASHAESKKRRKMAKASRRRNRR